MITDGQLYSLVNILGCLIAALIVLHNFIDINDLNNPSNSA
jgi:hypothetical protein